MFRFRPLGPVTLAGTVLALLTVSAASAADSKFLSNDTALVVTINWKQILESELVTGQKDAVAQVTALLDQFADVGTLRKALRDAGLDVLRDLRSITYVAGKESSRSVLILEGKFDTGLIAKLASKTVKSGPFAICEFALSDRRIFAGLVDNRTLIAAGTREALTDALGRSSNSGKPTLDKALAALTATTDSKQSANFLASGAALSRLMRHVAVAKAETAAAALKSLDGMAGSITVGKEIQFQVGIYAKTEETAKKFATAGCSALLAIRTSLRQETGEDPRLRPVLEVVETVRITGQGPNILIRGSANLDTIENLMRSLPVTRP